MVLYIIQYAKNVISYRTEWRQLIIMKFLQNSVSQKIGIKEQLKLSIKNLYKA